MSGTLLKRDSIQHKRLPVHIAKFLRTASLLECLRWLLIRMWFLHDNNTDLEGTKKMKILQEMCDYFTE